jgi:hypothetical protein
MKIGTVLAGILSLLSVAALSAGYQVSKKIPLPGTGGWDYLTVDESARRVYVSHATQVVVLDADSLEIVGAIPGLSGVHGITRNARGCCCQSCRRMSGPFGFRSPHS